jgi:RNA polymerase sigma factor for flagellar operon FliA
LVEDVARSLKLKADLRDLVQDGMKGILQAEQRYDAERGISFGQFAYYRIRGAILDGQREMGQLSRREHEQVCREAAAYAASEP